MEWYWEFWVAVWQWGMRDQHFTIIFLSVYVVACIMVGLFPQILEDFTDGKSIN